jgi:hypothetical protein
MLGDMHTVQLYDAFTINTILFLEDLGYCAKGEGKDFVGGGRIAPGGQLPVNTNGGGLSCVHPGMYGLFVMIEAIRQIRRAAGDDEGARRTGRLDRRRQAERRSWQWRSAVEPGDVNLGSGRNPISCQFPVIGIDLPSVSGNLAKIPRGAP